MVFPLPGWARVGGISNTAWRAFENTVHLWRTLRRQAAKSYTSRREMRQKSQPYNSQETAPTVFEIIISNTTTYNTSTVQCNGQRARHDRPTPPIHWRNLAGTIHYRAPSLDGHRPARSSLVQHPVVRNANRACALTVSHLAESSAANQDGQR